MLEDRCNAESVDFHDPMRPHAFEQSHFSNDIDIFGKLCCHRPTLKDSTCTRTLALVMVPVNSCD